MKKIICTVIVFAFLANVSAQLKVNSAGQVGIGTASPQYKLDVNGNTRVTGDIYLGGSTAGLIATTGNVPITFKVNGVLAGYTGNTENRSVSFGYRALPSNTTGYGSTAIGLMTLYSNTTGDYNTANGIYALYSNTTGNANTSNGSWALYHNTTGSFNTAYGEDALYHNTTGSYNIAIGHGADVYNNNQNNSTTIGYNVNATSSNQVRIGNSSVTSIGGYAAWTNFSDKRAKKNIRPDVPGLAFINRLQPVTFNLDLDAIDGLLKIDKTEREGEEELSQELKDINKKAREAKEKIKQTGFIAQDVEAIAKSIGYDFSGVDVDEAGIYGLRYAEFVVPLVKAVQELSEQVDELTELVHRLQGKDATLKNGIGGE
ncbi:MAG: tail fiber domain-containing protein [Dysgonamonadaceae bacterium]|nr:tail fiber domain-containing protein [Dysgonamonadaceae bacterium]